MGEGSRGRGDGEVRGDGEDRRQTTLSTAKRAIRPRSGPYDPEGGPPTSDTTEIASQKQTLASAPTRLRLSSNEGRTPVITVNVSTTRPIYYAMRYIVKE